MIFGRGRPSFCLHVYRVQNKGMQILLSNSQAGPGRRVKHEQEEISRNHVGAFIPGSVVCTFVRSFDRIQSLFKIDVEGGVAWQGREGRASLHRSSAGRQEEWQ